MRYGRDLERRRIADLVVRARDGRGEALVIRGEAGIGKTTLLTEAAVPDGAARVLRVRGVASEIELAFSGLHQLLGPVRSEVDDLPRNRAEALRAALDGDGPATDLRVCVAVYELLTGLASEGPLLIIADDAQDLDRASLAVLLFCARRADPGAFGMLIAIRDPDRREVDTHDLPELVLAGLDDVDAGTRALLLRTARGNPLALKQLTTADPACLAANALLTGSVPVDGVLRRVFRDRLDALPESERRALLVTVADDTGRPEIIAEAIARLGLSMVETPDGFAPPLARSVVYDTASGNERRAAHDALAHALAADPARARRHRALATGQPDENLAAALERDARTSTGYGGMAATTSVLLHAARLSVRPTERARRIALAAHAAWKSGHSGLARSLVSSAERASGDARNAVDLIRLRSLINLYGGHQPTAYAELVRDAETLRRKGYIDQAAELSFMAVDAAAHANLPGAGVTAAERVAATHADPAYRRYGRWIAATAAGRPDEASDSPWRVHDAAPANIARSGAHRWLLPLAICRESRRPRQAREFALAAVESMRTTGMIAICAVPMLWLAELEHRLGLWTEAASHALEGLALARDAGQPVAEADLLALLALLQADRGELTEAAGYATEALELARPYGNELAAAKAAWASGRVAALRGDATRAAEILDGIGETHARTAAESMMDLVEARARIGGGGGDLAEPGAGRRCPDGGDRDGVNLCAGSGPAVAEFPRSTEMTTGRHDPTAGAISECPPWTRAFRADPSGEADFRSALSSLDGQERPYEVARVSLAYGRWLRRVRRPRDARTPLRRAARLFDDLGARPWSDAAHDELRACGDAVRRPDAAPLTSRELTVATLAAGGLSNREIAARMFLSPRTVGYHLAKVFTKVGVSARAQLRDMNLAGA